MTFTASQVASFIRQAGAVAAIIVGCLSSPPILNLLPASVSSVLAGAGGLLVIVQHYVANPTTGTPASPVPAIPPRPVPEASPPAPLPPG